MSEPLVITLEAREWDIAMAARLELLLEPALDRDDVIVDMSRVTYMDSSCLGKLAAMRKKRVEHHSRPPSVLVVTSPAVHRIFSIVRFESLWKIVPTIEEAYDYIASADRLEETP